MFWNSKGYGRLIGYGLLVAGNYAATIPQLAQYSGWLVFIGTALGGAAHVNAMTAPKD
jgi:hypothetical protein